MADEPADTEDRMDRLERKLDELLAGGHAKAAEHEESKLGRPTEVQEQVRMELERAKAEEAEAAAKAAKEGEHQTLKETVAEIRAKLTEAKPQSPQPRRQRAMWGKQ
jgi:hypothetical protein